MTSFTFETTQDCIVYRATRMFGATQVYGALMQRLDKCARVYGADFTQFREQAEYLLLREADFAPGSGRKKSKELDEEWNEWAERVSRHLQDSALDHNFTTENKQLYQFLLGLSLGRTVVT